MGLLDGVLGGVVGAGMVGIINRVVEEQGGIQGIVSQFEQKGFGETVRSWVGTGPNQPVTGDQVHQALGPDLINKLATQFNMSPQDLTQKLAQVLPQAVDKATPGGTVPAA